MIDKKYTYSGKIFIKLCNNKLSILQKIAKRNVAILYGVAGDTSKRERLQLSVSPSNVDASVIIIKVEITNLLNNIEQIFEFSIDNCHFLLETFGGRHSECDKTFDMFGGYSVRSDGRLVESVFTADTGTVFTILADPRASVYGTYMWMYSLWLGDGRPVEHCVYIGDSVVTETQRFVDLKVAGTVKASVAERCYMTPVTEDSDPVVVPWKRDGRHMIMFLAKSMGVDPGAITLLCSDRRVIDTATSLDESKIRSSDARGSMTLIYDVLGLKVKCLFMVNKDHWVEVMIVGDQKVERVKERLSFKFKTSVRSLIICRKNILLSDEEGVSVDEELTFFMGQSPENIIRGDRVGSGGFGTVYRCTDGSAGDVMALKTFDQPMGDMMRCSIVREILATHKMISHENIVEYRKVYIDNDEISIGMEFVPQGSLTKYIDKYIKEYERPFSEDVIRRLTRGIVHGLNHLHCNKISHRDVKPANVLLGENEVAKLCDFGLSKVVPDFSTNGLYRNNTQTEEMGTFRWMAPEVMTWAPETLTEDTKKTKYSFKADIWSVGATVVQMITGEMPYYGQNDDTAIHLIAKTRTIPYTPPGELSVDLKEFVDACLQPRGEDRPRSNELISFPFLNPE